MSAYLPTPAADNLAAVLDFQTKEKIPSTVTFFPAAPPPPPAPAQPSPLGLAPQLPQPPVPGLTGVGGVGGVGGNNPTHTSADPVRYTNWGPKSLYFLQEHAPSSSKSTKKQISKKSPSGGSKKREKEKDKEPTFERVILSGSEEMQTTETTEVLGLNEGGGVKKTWVVRNTIVVVSVEKEVAGEDVKLSGDHGEGKGKGLEEGDRGVEKGKKSSGAESIERDIAMLLASGARGEIL